MTNADCAVRLDPHSGVSEEAEITGEPGRRMFSVMARPASGAPAAGVVICSPILAEAPNNYRREVVLSRRLASRGLAVMRFHYRGAGHSDGETGELTLAGMDDDTHAVADRLAEKAGVERVGFVGTRLGALVAAAGACRIGGGPVVLWEPVVDPARYFGEILRAQLVADLGGDLDAAFGHRPRPVLLVHFTKGTTRAGRPELGARLEERGFTVTAARLPNREAWWFPDDQATDALSGADESAIDLTVDWLARELVGAGSQR